MEMMTFSTENWNTQLAAHILSGAIFNVVFKSHRPSVSKKKTTTAAMKICMTNEVSKVLLISESSPLPMAKARNRRVALWSTLFNTVKSATKPPTTL